MVNKERISIAVSFLVIFVSLVVIFSNLNGFTGMASNDAGIINISVESNAQIEFVVSSIDFGSGRVEPGANSSIIDTLGNVINGTWNATTQGFIVANIGSSNVTLNLRAGRDASDFIGGTNPRYEYNVTNNETNSCLNSTGGDNLNLGSWNPVSTSDIGDRICDIFSFDQEKNSIRIDVLLEVPLDSNVGSRTDLFTATAMAI